MMNELHLGDESGLLHVLLYCYNPNSFLDLAQKDAEAPGIILSPTASLPDKRTHMDFTHQGLVNFLSSHHVGHVYFAPVDGVSHEPEFHQDRIKRIQLPQVYDPRTVPDTAQKRSLVNIIQMEDRLGVRTVTKQIPLDYSTMAHAAYVKSELLKHGVKQISFIPGSVEATLPTQNGQTAFEIFKDVMEGRIPRHLHFLLRGANPNNMMTRGLSPVAFKQLYEEHVDVTYMPLPKRV